jgi:hypothetical protein
VLQLRRSQHFTQRVLARLGMLLAQLLKMTLQLGGLGTMHVG